jgi:hypothetical protein
VSSGTNIRFERKRTREGGDQILVSNKQPSSWPTLSVAAGTRAAIGADARRSRPTRALSGFLVRINGGDAPPDQGRARRYRRLRCGAARRSGSPARPNAERVSARAKARSIGARVPARGSPSASSSCATMPVCLLLSQIEASDKLLHQFTLLIDRRFELRG